MRLFRIKCKGSTTVEAVFIVPIVLGVIFSLIIMIFYLHDYSTIKSYANLVLMESEESLTNIYELASESSDGESKGFLSSIFKGKSKVKLEKGMMDELNKGLWFVKVEELSFGKNKIYRSIKIKSSGKVDFPIINIFLEEALSVSVNSRAIVVQPEISKELLKREGD